MSFAPGNHVGRQFERRLVLRSMTMDHQILVLLKAGPAHMPQLTAALHVENTRAGRQVIQRRLSALRRTGKVKRIGARNLSLWALVTFRGKVVRPPCVPAGNRGARPVQSPPRESWWAVPPEDFADAARRRASLNGWADTDDDVE